MKSHRLMLWVVLMSLTALGFAQSDAQKSFDKLKTLAGSWEGNFQDGPIHVTLRVTSMGNTLMHEIKGSGPEDPITMITVDGDRLLLTHYCDAGNQPRMVGTVSPDGKTITFNFIDATNLLPAQGGHMQRAIFNLIDADHHTEKWEFAMADGKPMGGVLDLKRSK
ncbi:MAG: hypothetical protein WCA16_06600 [Candidatus Sulfotelmatobacter sp.]